MSRNTLVAICKLAITVVLLYLFLRRTDFGALSSALSRLSPVLIVSLALLNLSGVFLSAYKWQLLLPEATFKRLLVACFASYYIGLLLPGQLAQEAAKAYYLVIGDRQRMHRIAASVAVDKLISIVALLVVGLMGLAFTPSDLPASLTWLFLGSTILAILLLFSLRVPWLYSRFSGALDTISVRLPRQERILRGGSRLLAAWHTYSKQPWLLAGNAAVSIVYQLLGVLMYYFLSNALHKPVGFFDWSWIIGALTLALFLPLTIGGLGVREGTLIAILTMFGYDKETALVVSFVAFACVLMIAVLGAAILLTVKIR